MKGITLTNLKAMVKEFEENRYETKLLTPIKSIRVKCLDCSNYQYKEVRLCPVKSCSLYPYRMGKRPAKEAGNN